MVEVFFAAQKVVWLRRNGGSVQEAFSSSLLVKMFYILWGLKLFIEKNQVMDCLPPNAKVVETFLQEVLG